MLARWCRLIPGVYCPPQSNKKNKTVKQLCIYLDLHLRFFPRYFPDFFGIYLALRSCTAAVATFSRPFCLQNVFFALHVALPSPFSALPPSGPPGQDLPSAKGQTQVLQRESAAWPSRQAVPQQHCEAPGTRGKTRQSCVGIDLTWTANILRCAGPILTFGGAAAAAADDDDAAAAQSA